MKKIKKFKVNLRKREVIHNFKVISQIKQITAELEEHILKEMNNSAEYLFPASMFDTFFLPKMEDAIRNFGLSFNCEPEVIAISVIVATIGEEIENRIQLAKEQGEQLRSQILDAIGIEGYNSSLNFIYRIISEEAEKEECKVMPIEKVLDETSKLNIIKNFNTKRIGVYIDDKSQIRPEFTAVATVKWLPVRKHKITPS